MIKLRRTCKNDKDTYKNNDQYLQKTNINKLKYTKQVQK